ncbi:aldehyde dehydrogenase family protein [Microbacterium azadirachtae]|uniref:aldehyde dehydrogenase family protein n=1 Tax=Microbacterium azadirachtae TaxID=582680 RepID=UPI000888F7AC|nr:aldehyde dehydrogenase family protein [Microbacterium azadirachtae]SDM14812.1 benzaldehyde dehydrogenase (NAD+) [Microbacterium azadirachtae]SEG38580.1 benzaldehyde dehydrogenase (NAD+) [Microbacterium azadirachtae]SEG41471.1 benzaldehyde dehydrogenase (NAD+) [Microbacterium azadirachtae]
MARWDIEDIDGLIFSDGWRPGGGGAHPIVSPGDGGVVAHAGLADESDVERAGASAAAAQAAWGRASYRTRADVLLGAAAALRQIRAEVEHVLIRESGSLPGKASHEVDKAIDELVAAAGLVTMSQGDLLPVEDPSTIGMARRIPVGVVGVIAPWNAPLMLAIRSVAPAIALGNAVLLKPDVKTAFSGGAAIAEVFRRAGLPDGVLHVLPGGPETGEAVVRSPHTSVISFTGSSAAGRRVGEVAGGLLKRVVLELGGNNAFVVMADADLDRAVAAGVAGSFRHQGQICMATGRHLVHESIADEYVERLRAAAAALVPGDPLAPGTTLGPLITAAQTERVHGIVQAAVADGARVMHGGAHDGLFYAPTVLDRVDPDNAAFRAEIFGPVAPVTRFRTEEEALVLANASDYGLTAAIHTRDVARALGFAARLRAGMVAVNGQTIYDAAHIPMGGIGASGNGGRHGGHWNLDEFTYWQWVTVPTISG